MNKKSEEKKIIEFRHIKRIIPLIKDKRTVVTGGCFDIFHYGHLIFLEKAKRLGNYLIVLLESDRFIKISKNKDCVHNQNQRAAIVGALSIVDLVIKLPLFKSDEDYDRLIKTIRPKIIAVTKGDLKMKKKQLQARQNQAELKIVTPLLTKFSSTKITQ